MTSVPTPPIRYAAFSNLDPAFGKLVDRCLVPNPKIADLIRSALAILDIDRDDEKATVVLLSILLHDDLAEAINGRL